MNDALFTALMIFTYFGLGYIFLFLGMYVLGDDISHSEAAIFITIWPIFVIILLFGTIHEKIVDSFKRRFR